MLLLGFNAQVIQLILFRETLLLSSGSEVSLGLSIAAWALFNGAGSFAGWVALKRGFRPGRLFTGLLYLLPLVLAVSVHGARIARGFTTVPGGEELRLFLFCGLASAVLAPVTFLDGFLYVSALDGIFGRRKSGQKASMAYGVESAGALAGGLVFTFLLVLFMDPFTIAGLLLVINALFLRTPLKARLFGEGRQRRAVRPAAFLLGVAALVFGPELNGISEARRWRILQPEMDLMENRESRHQYLAVLRYQEDYSVFGNGHLIHTLRSRRSAESGDWNRAVPPNFAALQHPGPKRIVLLGGGSKGYLTDLLEYGPQKLDWVEYDRELVGLVKRYMLPEEREAFGSGRVRFHVTDGRYFIKRLPRASVDLILVDVPDPANAALNRYYTLEFFRECRAALDRGGVLVIGLSCQPNFLGKAMLRRNGAVYAALRETFPYLLVTPGTFSFLAAAKEEGRLSADAAELVKRYQARGIQSDRFSPYLFYTWFQEDDVQWINRVVFAPALASGSLEVNCDDRPVAYFADTKLFTRITGTPGEGGFVERAEAFFTGTGEGFLNRSTRWLPLLFPLMGLVLFAMGWRVRGRKGPERPRRFLLLVTAATVGFSGITVEMGALMAFQSVSGHLYSRMGFIIAAYMAGLAIGALGPGVGGRPRSAFIAAAVAMAVGTGGCVGLFGLAGGFPGGEAMALLLFGLITLVLGTAGGFSFRAIALALESPDGTAGGLIYTLDILGPCVGGWPAGALLVPLQGIRATLLLAGAIAVFMCLLCLFSEVRRRTSAGL